jgi:Calx-beta domain-containing protein/Big-like domain-containing protein/uncharacterized protein DUF4214
MKFAALRLKSSRTFILSLASFVAVAAFITLAVSASRNARRPVESNATFLSVSEFAANPELKNSPALRPITPLALNTTTTLKVTATLDFAVNDAGDAADLSLDGICDTDGAPGEQCTLRAAIQETNNAATDDSINFSLPPSIITLDTELPAINGNLIITGPAANLLTVQRSLVEDIPEFRIFTINSGNTVTISGLTVSNGNLPTGSGGGILNNNGILTLNAVAVSGNKGGTGGGVNNNGGTLTINNSTISSNNNSGEGLSVDQSTSRTNSMNAAGDSGGGLSNSGTAVVTNSTISANITLGGGGGVENAGTLTLVNVTVYANSASVSGGGVDNTGSGTLNFRNTIIAGNLADAGPDLNGPNLISQDYNLIGDTTGATITGITTNNISNVDARLAPIADNGGPTLTNALLSGSPAIDAADNCVTQVAGCLATPLTTDQRGVGFSRITDGPDVDATATVDIGASEAQPSIEDIPDQTTNEDVALPTFNFAVSDGGLASISVTVTSDDQTLVPDESMTVGGSGSTRTLSVTPATNEFGQVTIIVRVSGTVGSSTVSMTDFFILNINAVNDAPSFTKGPDQNVQEDAGTQEVPGWATDISEGAANESGQLLTFLVTNNTNSALFSTQPAIVAAGDAAGTLSYTPAVNANGLATITIALKDDGGIANGGQDTSPTQTFNITVDAVSDAPVATNDSYSTPENTTLNVNAPGVLTNDTDAENNTLTAILVSGPSHASAFALSANGSFNYTPTANFSGTDTFTYKANDGTTDGNTATVTITVNDGGTLQFSATTYSVSENAGPATITISRTGGSAGTATVLFSTSNGTATAADYTSVSQTVTFNDGETTKTVNVPITDDPLNEPDETVNLTLSNAGGTGQLGAPSTAVLTILNDDAAGGIVRFSAATYLTTESSGSTTITVERSGDTSQAATVDYASVDGSPSSPCSTINGMASQQCDYTLVVGTLKFAAGETSKTFTVLISQDSYVEGLEAFTLTLSNLTGGAVFGTPSTATLTITDDASEPPTNAIDDVDTFVRQHYHDFLNREPDAGGLAYWKNEITKCGSDARCIHNRRIDVSAAFFVESEFQQTAYFVYRMYLASYGRHPTYVELMADRQLIDFANLVQSKQQFADGWVQRMAFTDFYDPSLSNAAFVNLLFDTAGLPGHAAERQQQIDAMNAGKSRADVVRDLVETAEFYNREFNGAFVATQYFGYLRRDPDQGGYNHWLDVLNNLVPNNFRAMVCAFLTSSEYQLRFGATVSRMNSDCAP